MIRVYKFGGASVRNADAVMNLGKILENKGGAPLAVVISAMGKTTNAIENLLAAYRNKDQHATTLLQQLVHFHLNICQELFSEKQPTLHDALMNLFRSLEVQLVADGLDYNQHYDQTVSYGELLSTTIVAHYLQTIGLKIKHVDARDLIATDDHYRAANILWDTTCKNLQALFYNSSGAIMLTQGFIGRSSNGKTTTLGREGSDFSAAILAYCLNADELVIWKDVPGLMNADPKRFPDCLKIDQISYQEAIELSYYGATVIHPKTMKPLQNKQIPLKVASFLNPDEPPTVIHSNPEFDTSIPSFIIKDKQMLLSFSARDFSFMNEERLHQLFGSFHSIGLHANLLQASALSLSVCVNEDEEILQKIVEMHHSDYTIKYNRCLELLTIRHYTAELAEKFSKGREVLLEQRSRVTLQLVLRNITSSPQ